MHKIIIFSPYFGTLPDYFQLWLNSCRLNEDFTWAVITDAATDGYEIPDNVKILHMHLSEFSQFFSTALDLKISIAHPYKICDLRPAFSILLALFPGQWDFWGHCDLDMMFGRLRNFISDEMLSNYDKIFGVGHLTLYRNDASTNSFYKRDHPSLDYREIFSQQDHFGFDEHIGVNRIWKMHSGRFYENEQVLADISPHKRRLSRASNYIYVRNYDAQIFTFENGATYRVYYHGGKIKRQEFMYVHFQKRGYKGQYFSSADLSICLTPDGFAYLPASSDLDRKTLEGLNPRSPTISLKEVKRGILQGYKIAKYRLGLGIENA